MVYVVAACPLTTAKRRKLAIVPVISIDELPDQFLRSTIQVSEQL